MRENSKDILTKAELAYQRAMAAGHIRVAARPSGARRYSRAEFDSERARAAIAANAPTNAPKSASVFDLVTTQPWAMTPAMLETVLTIARQTYDGPVALEARPGRPLQNAPAVTMRGGVAVVPLVGPLMRYDNAFSRLIGATSLEQIALDFNAALADPSVRAIVLNIDSPGGQVSGIAEFAQMVRSAIKPVVAYVGGAAASAAYWIAAAAKSVVIATTGEVGSIGVVVTVDSRRNAGVLEVVSSQSPNKRADVTTDAGRALIQARTDGLARVFVDDIAAYRGVSSATVLANFGQGDMHMGRAAVKVGMADSVGTLESVIARLSTL